MTADTDREYQALQEIDPWEDSSWLPADAEILLPHDALSRLMLETPVSALAIPEPATIGPDASMQAAMFEMRQYHVRALLVVENGQLLGIVTDRDAVQYLDPGQTGEDVRVRDVMTPDPITVSSDDPVGKAAQVMLTDGVHHLPVVDDGRIIGIVAQGRVLHAMITEMMNQGAP